MSRYLQGDVVLCHFPYSEKDGEKRRPALIYDVIGEDYYTLMFTTKDKRGKCAGIWIEKNSIENKSLRLSENSFLNITHDFVVLRKEDIIKLIGICPKSLLSQIEKICRENDIELP
ncbi:MAG: type II toxin-antitoxin system PemK/MazF family toxin [Bacteroidetes bacterium]|nr:type II toxin-antitoxin system PemK/MazF family toxin [Bacteroidota bacterium]